MPGQSLALHVNALRSAAGSTSLIPVNTIPTGDGANLAGVPLWNAILRYIYFRTSTGTLQDAQLQGQDLFDPKNGLDFGAAVTNPLMRKVDVPYKAGQLLGSMQQSVAGTEYTAHIWEPIVPDPKPYATWQGALDFSRIVCYPQTFGAAMTAGQWSTQQFAPSNMKIGDYAFLGVGVQSLATNAGHALARFSHSYWGPYKPGFPVKDVGASISYADIAGYPKWATNMGSQFYALGAELGRSACPIVTVSQQGTGFSIELYGEAADTPTVVPYFQYLGPPSH